MSADLENLSGILKKRNALDDEISRIIGYPAEKGHIESSSHPECSI